MARAPSPRIFILQVLVWWVEVRALVGEGAHSFRWCSVSASGVCSDHHHYATESAHGEKGCSFLEITLSPAFSPPLSREPRLQSPQKWHHLRKQFWGWYQGRWALAAGMSVSWTSHPISLYLFFPTATLPLSNVLHTAPGMFILTESDQKTPCWKPLNVRPSLVPGSPRS